MLRVVLCKRNDIKSFYKKIGDTLKSNYSNSNAWFITSNVEALKLVGLTGLVLVPFGKFSIPVLTKIADMVGMDLLPSSFREGIEEAYAVRGSKVEKFITGHNLTLKGRKYKQIDFETIKIDNVKGLITLRVLAPKKLFGMETPVTFKTLRRGPFLKTDTSKKLKEDIHLPVQVGDTVVMGRFKNKKVKVKSIEVNEKGDVLIMGNQL